MKIVWLRRAGQSLDEVFEFLEALNPLAAANIYNNILDEVERLATMPFMAPVEPNLDRETKMFRSLIACRRYKLIYYVEDNSIFIADVWDCRQDPEALRERVVELAEK